VRLQVALSHRCGHRRGRGEAPISGPRTLARELDRLLKLKPTNAEGRHLRDAIFVDAQDKLLVFLTRRDVEPTNNESERALRPSVIFRKVTMSEPAASTAGAPSPLSAPLSRCVPSSPPLDHWAAETGE
jgi:Transposase IS66 family